MKRWWRRQLVVWPRRGRVLPRLGLVWLVLSVAVFVVSNASDSFELTSPWNALIVGAVLGVVNVLVWPFLVRLLLPFTVLTLGLGAFALYAVLVIGVLTFVPGVVVTRAPLTSLLVTVLLAGLTSFLTGLLDIDDDELFQRRAASRALRRQGAPSTTPGVVFLQIDGLGYDVLRRAMRDGDAPALGRWVEHGTHVLSRWETDWSSQTGASQAGLLHGSNDDMPAFRWYEKDAGRVMVSNRRSDAAEIERRISDGRGLLHADGAGRGNLFTGDSADTILTMSVAGRRRGRGIGAGYYGYFANPYNATRTLFSTIAEIARELSAAGSQRRLDVQPRVPRGRWYPFLRAFTTVISRDVIVQTVLDDMMAGRSVVYADLLGYDEVAHHSGIERYDTLAVLRGIDRQIGRLARATAVAPRPYRFVVLSDHGQSQGKPFAARFGVSLEDLVRTACGRAPTASGGPEVRAAGGAEAWQTVNPRGVSRREAARAAAEHQAAEQGLLVLGSGSLGLVYFTAVPGRMTRAEIDRDHPDLLPTLLAHPGIGFVLVRGSAGEPLVLGAGGGHDLATGEVTGTDPLLPYGPLAAERVRRTDGFAHTADLMINASYSRQRDEISAFETLSGSHGGMGGAQSRPFLLHPADLPMPDGALVGAERVHLVLRSWLARLGHAAFDDALLAAQGRRDAS